MTVRVYQGQTQELPNNLPKSPMPNPIVVGLPSTLLLYPDRGSLPGTPPRGATAKAKHHAGAVARQQARAKAASKQQQQLDHRDTV